MKPILFSICLTLSIHLTFAQGAEMKVHVIDVGQGSATLIEFECGAMLIDTGGESNADFASTDALLNYLSDFFDRRTDLNKTLKLLVITHPHIDHTRGIKDVLAQYRVENVITNGENVSGSGIAQQKWLQKEITNRENDSDPTNDIHFLASAADKIMSGGNTSPVIDPINCPAADPMIKILWGTLAKDPGWGNGEDGKPNFDDQNNHSVVIKIELGNAKMIVTGDLEEPAIATLLTKHPLTAFQSQLYLVGHHGSKNGTTLNFLKAVKPEMAVLSFGDPTRKLSYTAWDYGHPNAGIIKLLSDNVTGTRPSKQVSVGNGKQKFKDQTISKAIYGVGWDGSIVLSARANDPNGGWKVGDLSTVAIAAPATLTNINSATKQELMNLPYIGEVRAEQIIQYRTQHPFTSIEELKDVPKVRSSVLELIRPLIKV